MKIQHPPPVADWEANIQLSGRIFKITNVAESNIKFSACSALSIRPRKSGLFMQGAISEKNEWDTASLRYPDSRRSASL